MGAIVPRVLIPGKLERVPFYGLNVQTGVLAGVAAGTSSAGHIIGVRNADTAMCWAIYRMRAKITNNPDPTAQQMVGILLNKLTAYSAAHTGSTGGSNVSPYARSEAGANGYSSISSSVVARVSGTDALTAGTQTIGEKLGGLDALALANAATVKKTEVERQWVSNDKHPLFILGPSEGLLVRNTVLQGAGLGMIVDLELEGPWFQPTPA